MASPVKEAASGGGHTTVPMPAPAEAHEEGEKKSKEEVTPEMKELIAQVCPQYARAALSCCALAGAGRCEWRRAGARITTFSHRAAPRLSMQTNLETGLTSAQYAERLAQYGENVLEDKKRNKVLLFLSFLWGPMPVRFLLLLLSLARPTAAPASTQRVCRVVCLRSSVRASTRVAAPR
ncbi:hypothetical protein EON67_05590 [archaeon]|nr:MAG: hypothetical protein EON67_05590 [archaeon]